MRVLILSDIHANLVALETVLQAAQGRYDEIWCLGDIVGYGPRPNECVELLRDKLTLCVIGNHDWAALGRTGIDVDAFNPVAKQAILWTQQQLTVSTRSYLSSLISEPIQPYHYSKILLTHASPRQPVWEYILTPSVALENFAYFGQEICFVGHTHKPIIYEWVVQQQLNGYGANYPTSPHYQYLVAVNALQLLPGVTIHLDTSPEHRLILNPGSVGQPRDHDTRAAYGILDLEAMTWRSERVPYPIELTQSQMRAAKLPQRLVERLSFGF